MRSSHVFMFFIILSLSVSVSSKKSKALKKGLVKLAKSKAKSKTKTSSKKKAALKKGLIKLAKHKAKKKVKKALSKPSKSKSKVNLSSRKASCVSTEWIRRRGLEDKTFGTPQTAQVLCIPDEDLPCGTPGHLLRNVQQSSLISYQDVCEQRSDCMESTMLVSKLSHSFDWSQFKIEGRLELTSVSASTSSSPFSFSRIMAVAADGLIRNGMGYICDFAMIIARAYGSTLDVALKFTDGRKPHCSKVENGGTACLVDARTVGGRGK